MAKDVIVAIFDNRNQAYDAAQEIEAFSSSTVDAAPRSSCKPDTPEETRMTWLRRLGRLCIATIFLAGGWDAVRSPGARVAKVTAVGLPKPELLARANGAAMAIAGSALALGWHPREAAAVLAGELVPTTIVGHPFWRETTPSGRAAQQVHFLKNLGLFSGLLLVLADEHAAVSPGGQRDAGNEIGADSFWTGRPV